MLLRLEIPQHKKLLREIEAENSKLQFEIAKFESPTHLMELAQQPQFSHLHYPKEDEVVILP